MRAVKFTRQPDPLIQLTLFQQKLEKHCEKVQQACQVPLSQQLTQYIGVQNQKLKALEIRQKQLNSIQRNPSNKKVKQKENKRTIEQSIEYYRVKIEKRKEKINEVQKQIKAEVSKEKRLSTKLEALQNKLPEEPSQAPPPTFDPKKTRQQLMTSDNKVNTLKFKIRELESALLEQLKQQAKLIVESRQKEKQAIQLRTEVYAHQKLTKRVGNILQPVQSKHLLRKYQTRTPRGRAAGLEPIPEEGMGIRARSVK